MRRRLDLTITAGQFKLELEEVMLALKEMIGDGFQHGIIDKQNNQFYHLTEQENVNLVNLFSKGQVLITDVAQEMEIPPNAIKSWMKLLIDAKRLQGTFDPTGNTFIPATLVRQQVKDSFIKSGKLGITEAANALNLPRQDVIECIRGLGETRELNGLYTADNEYFITSTRLEEDIIDFIRDEKRFPIRNLAAKLAVNENILKDFLDGLIMTGKVRGVTTFSNEFVSDEQLEQALIDAIIPYSRMSISELAEQFAINEKNMKSLIGRAISKGLVHGSIDSVSNEFVKERIVAPTTPVAPKAADLIDVKRDYDYLGGDIHFKVALQNITQTTVSKLSVLLNVPDQFELDKNVEKVEILNPSETRGVDFVFTPLACGKAQIFGTVSYTDAYGEPHSVTIRPKEVWVKCPLVKSQETSKTEADRWREQLQRSTTTIDATGIFRLEAFRIACEQIAALDLAEVERREDDYVGVFSGIAKVTGDRLLVEISLAGDKIILDIYTQDQKQATGFLAYMRNLIKISLDVSRKLRVKSEKLGGKVLTAFQIAQGLFNLCDNCETRAPICDFILQLKEIIFKIGKEFPEIKFVAEAKEWLDNLSQLDEDAPIPVAHANLLEYVGLTWLREIESLAENTAVIYLDGFDSPDDTRDRKIGGGLMGIHTEIERKESNYSLRIAHYLLIIHKGSGLCLYNHKFGPGEIDPDLMSGFLQAIQSFGTEFTPDDSGEAGMRRLSYKDFEISLEESDYVRVALVAIGKITDFLQDLQKDFVKLFSGQYQTDLAQFHGNVQVFSGAGALIKNLFGIQ